MTLAEQPEQLERIANRDSLTDLANRAFFDTQLEEALKSHNIGSIHVLLLDLDDFKEVNDSHGRDAGDALLVETSRRLRERVGPNNTSARFGGDEFAVLLTDATDADDDAARIVGALGAPFRFDGKELQPSISLGFAANGDPSLKASELLRRAGIALYIAKAAGKNRFVRFRPGMMSVLVAHNDVESGLRYAVERHEIIVHYQPIVNLEVGGVDQVEALARWSRAGDLILPGEFVPAAEASGLIKTIGQEILRLTCAQLSDWLAVDNMRSVAVNVSAVQLREPDFAHDTLDTLDSAGVDPRQLVVELTESALPGSVVQTIDQLSQLRARGIRVSLDDFGTGYSSLERLQKFPVDIIKIDRSFVDGIRSGDETLPILHSIVDLAHNLGLHVTAEGIETATQALYLQQLGCDSMQGFYFGRATAVEFLADVESQASDAYRKLTAPLIATKGESRPRY
jgi:diguanylate cyclase (GGDEF)-like protein